MKPMTVSSKRREQISQEFMDNPNLTGINGNVIAAAIVFAKDHPEEAEVLRQWLETDPAPTVDDLSEEDRLGYALTVAEYKGDTSTARLVYLTGRNINEQPRASRNAKAAAVVAEYKRIHGDG